MTLIRVLLRRASKSLPQEVLVVNTIHDSIIYDSPKEHVDKVVEIVIQCFIDVNDLFLKSFGIPLTVPIESEIKVGKNLKEMYEIKH